MWRQASRLKDANKYTSFLVQWAQKQTDPDKMTRISNLLKTDAQVKDESIKDSLLDMANYAMILASYIEDKKGGINEK
jgi:hypothetical protein